MPDCTVVMHYIARILLAVLWTLLFISTALQITFFFLDAVAVPISLISEQFINVTKVNAELKHCAWNSILGFFYAILYIPVQTY